MNNAYSALARLNENRPLNVTELRALEANAAAAYFRAWRNSRQMERNQYSELRSSVPEQALLNTV
jgi:CRISPR/Cas system-associated endonuclease Cas1